MLTCVTHFTGKCMLSVSLIHWEMAIAVYLIHSIHLNLVPRPLPSLLWGKGKLGKVLGTRRVSFAQLTRVYFVVFTMGHYGSQTSLYVTTNRRRSLTWKGILVIQHWRYHQQQRVHELAIDYDEAKWLIGVPARTRQVLASIQLYIQLYTVEGMLDVYIVHRATRYHVTAFLDVLLLKDYMLNPCSS